MNHIRTLVDARSGPQRLLPTFATALVLTACLLAMHTFTGTPDTGHAEKFAVASEPAHAAPGSESGMAATGTKLEATTGTSPEASAVHCGDDCEGAGGVPGHSMLMMACVPALAARTAHSFRGPGVDYLAFVQVDGPREWKAGTRHAVHASPI